MRDYLTSFGWWLSGFLTRSKSIDATREASVRADIAKLQDTVRQNRAESALILARCEELVGVSGPHPGLETVGDEE